MPRIVQMEIVHSQGGETDFIISVLIGTLLFCEVINSSKQESYSKNYPYD